MQYEKEAVRGVESVELEEIEELTAPSKPVLGADKYLNVVRDVEIRLSAVLGEAQLSVGELFKLKEGGVLSLDQITTDPVELLLNGQVVAKGNLVVVDDNFGIQLTEICEL